MGGIATDRLPVESPRAYQAFCWWVEQSPRPQYQAVAKEFHASHNTVRAWASRNSWADRAAQFDREQLEANLARRDVDREAARQQLVDSLPLAVSTLLGIAEGRLLSEGDQVPVLDRHGVPVIVPVERDGEVVQVAQTRPVVGVTERRRAALAVLEMSGVSVPKRVELTGPDGTEVKIRARHALSDLSGKQLAALAEAFGVET